MSWIMQTGQAPHAAAPDDDRGDRQQTIKHYAVLDGLYWDVPPAGNNGAWR